MLMLLYHYVTFLIFDNYGVHSSTKNEEWTYYVEHYGSEVPKNIVNKLIDSKTQCQNLGPYGYKGDAIEGHAWNYDDFFGRYESLTDGDYKQYGISRVERSVKQNNKKIPNNKINEISKQSSEIENSLEDKVENHTKKNKDDIVEAIKSNKKYNLNSEQDDIEKTYNKVKNKLFENKPKANENGVEHKMYDEIVYSDNPSQSPDEIVKDEKFNSKEVMMKFNEKNQDISQNEINTEEEERKSLKIKSNKSADVKLDEIDKNQVENDNSYQDEYYEEDDDSNYDESSELVVKPEKVGPTKKLNIEKNVETE